MRDPLNRFSSRVQGYARYRPGYPPALLEILISDCALSEDSIIADVGSGTGILSELFLKKGCQVFAIEPNAAMRSAAEQGLKHFEKFQSVSASAEATTLEPASVDFITAGQAFHWFERREAKKEFRRILKPNGWVVLIWNQRRLSSTPFLRQYEDLLLSFGTDYQEVRHENVETEIAEFFAPASLQLRNVENFQHCNFEALKGRVCSSSYAPEPGAPNFDSMIAQLKDIFHANEKAGMVTIEYDTKVYYGHLE